MVTAYRLSDLTLQHVTDLPAYASVQQLPQDDDGYWLAYEAKPELITAPEVVYTGNKRLQPTGPNFLGANNPGLLFPVVTPGHNIAATRLHNALCISNGIIVTRPSQIHAESFRHISRSKYRISVEAKGDKFCVQSSDKIYHIPGKSLFLDGEHFGAYGHWVGEILTRLWIHQFVDLSEFTIICGREKPNYLLPLLEPFGIRGENIFYNDGIAFCEDLLVPSQSFLVRQSTTSVARDLWNFIATYYDQHRGPEKIYVSRSKSSSRPLQDEGKVEDLFRQVGFEIVHPESLSISEQINIFRNAKYIAGPSGSALFNCAFSKPNQKKLILTSENYILHSDVLFHNPSTYPITFFIGEAKADLDVHAAWSVDLPALEKTVNQWLENGQASERT